MQMYQHTNFDENQLRSTLTIQALQPLTYTFSIAQNPRTTTTDSTRL